MKLSVFLIMILCLSTAQADETYSSKAGAFGEYSLYKPMLDSGLQFNLQTEFESYNSLSEQGALSNFQGELSYSSANRPKLKTSSNLKIQYKTNKEMYYTVPELYLGYDFGSFEFGLGRKFLPGVGALEKIWQISSVYPFLKANPLQSEIQSLVGFHGHIKISKNYGVAVIGSPVTIPNQGVSVEFDKNGKPDYQSPWFAGLPETLRFQGQDFSLTYELNDPDIVKLLSKPYAGIQIYGKENPVEWNVSYFISPLIALYLAWTLKLGWLVVR